MNKAAIDSLIEKTVVPSFSRLGLSIRSRLFRWKSISSYSLKGRVVVLTGGTSGIGEAAAMQYAQLGATLIIIARNAEKAKALIDSINAKTGNNDIHCVLADLGKQDEVRNAASEIASHWPAIDVLVHNAGALFNQRRRADNGTDLAVELMVAAPFLLTGLLLDNLKAATNTQQAQSRNVTPAPARVLTMSSGGMYTEALDVEHIEMQDAQYQGAQQYARAKRAQVILNELWAEHIPSAQIVFHALHPGWVKTPGITEALPGFSRVLGPLGLLRSADEGADCLLWLSAEHSVSSTSGGFWHDRQQRDIDMKDSTRKADTPEERQALWHWCELHTNWTLPS